MPYDLYPAVDEDYVFPPEIRVAFANSIEFVSALTTALTAPGTPLPTLVSDALEGLSIAPDSALAVLIAETIEDLAGNPASQVYMSIEDRVLESLTTVAPGAVQDFSERTSNFSTSNNTLNDMADTSLIGGLLCDAVGTGRPLEVVFFSPFAVSSSASAYINPYLLTSVNGGAYGVSTFYRMGAVSSPSNTAGRSINASWDIPTIDGNTYAFKVGMATQAGVLSLIGSGIYPTTLKVRNH